MKYRMICGLALLCVAGLGSLLPARAEPATDTARLGRILQEIDRDYRQLMARYRTQTHLSTQQRRLYQSMQQMHGQAMRACVGMMHGGRMGGGMMRRMMTRRRNPMAAREWEQQMMSMHQQMAALHRRRREMGMAAMQDRLAHLYGRALQATGTSSLPSRQQAGSVDGAAAFTRNCASCHGVHGQGMAGLFPPLASPDRVTGDTDRTVSIVLHGLHGRLTVAGHSYDGVMPGFGARLSDAEIAAILTYLRSSRGNHVSEVTVGEVHHVRQITRGRTGPWAASKLQQHKR